MAFYLMNIEAMATHLYRSIEKMRTPEKNIVLAEITLLNNGFYRNLSTHSPNGFKCILAKLTDGNIVNIDSVLLSLFEFKNILQNNPQGKFTLIYFQDLNSHRFVVLEGSGESFFVQKFKECINSFADFYQQNNN